jgi:osmotically-inducible protein OsmY
MSKTDSQLKKDIEEELLWDPKVNSERIGVSVDDGSVALLGTVDSYAERWAAEDATKRVSGVGTVVQNLVVKLRPEHVHSDSDIAAAIQNALKWNVYIPKTVTAQVQQGSVQLEGQVTWNYQRVVAERAVRYLSGVVDVHNLITLKPQSPKARVNGKVTHFWSRWASYLWTQPSAKQIKETVLAALQRQAAVDATSIHVYAQDTQVTLTGNVSSRKSIADAANAAWAVPGVTHVIDHITFSR